MSRNLSVVLLVLLTMCFLPAFGDEKEDIDKEKAAVFKMRDDVLKDLYKEKPELRDKIKKAAGYAVFNNAGLHVLLLATSRGKGVAIDNKTQKPVFMKMRTIGAGPGLGVKDYRVVFIFPKAATLKNFMDAGWSFTGEADAAAKTKKEGAAASASRSSSEDMEIYTITKKGVALQATLGGTRFSRDDDLN